VGANRAPSASHAPRRCGRRGWKVRRERREVRRVSRRARRHVWRRRLGGSSSPFGGGFESRGV
jgi:hypothetical protein